MTLIVNDHLKACKKVKKMKFIHTIRPRRPLGKSFCTRRGNAEFGLEATSEGYTKEKITTTRTRIHE